MGRGFLDLADVRACRACGRDYLHVRDAYTDGVIQLEPWATRGVDVTRGWYLRLDGHTPIWAEHRARHADPGVFAFFDHYCPAPHRQEGTPQVTTSTDPFGTAAPPGAGGPSMAELENKLVLITLVNIERGIQTSNGPSDAAKVDLVDLTNGEAHPNSALWGKVIVPQLASSPAGTKFVGRIVKGTPTGSQSPPWTWQDGTADDKQVALRYLNHVNGVAVGVTPPAAPAPAAPAPAPVATPAAPDAAKPPWL